MCGLGRSIQAKGRFNQRDGRPDSLPLRDKQPPEQSELNCILCETESNLANTFESRSRPSMEPAVDNHFSLSADFLTCLFIQLLI